MNQTDLFISSLDLSQTVMQMFLADFSDEDLMARPCPGANHVAWQLGHLISAEQQILAGMGADMPALPDGFDARYTRETSQLDDAASFDSKATYLELYAKVRAATKAFVQTLDPAKLDGPAPEPLRTVAPRVGDALLLAAGHQMMHMGQATAVRRKLGKPIAF